MTNNYVYYVQQKLHYVIGLKFLGNWPLVKLCRYMKSTICNETQTLLPKNLRQLIVEAYWYSAPVQQIMEEEMLGMSDRN